MLGVFLSILQRVLLAYPMSASAFEIVMPLALHNALIFS